MAGIRGNHLRVSDQLSSHYFNDFLATTKIGRVRRYTNKPDKKAMHKFIDSRIFYITINSKDQITRFPLLSKIEIKCINSPDILKQLQEEFQDRRLYRLAKEYSRGYLKEGERKTPGWGREISFKAVKGAQYEIQVLKQNYHYFQTTFTADNSSKEKSVLLVEKGAKIRIDTTKQGQGRLINQ